MCRNSKYFKLNQNVSKPCLKELLSIASLNIQGIINKVDDNDFVNIVQNHDIFFTVTETWLSNENFQCVELADYVCINKICKKVVMLGEALVVFLFFIKKNLTKFISSYKSKCEFLLWIKIDKTNSLRNRDLFIGATYIPPEGSPYSKDVYKIIQDD